MTTPRSTHDTEVLVCGAGPTGMVLALRLQRVGVRVRVIDAAPGPGMASRALAVHARTLEFYRQMGFADDVVAAGIRFTAANIWVRGRRVGTMAMQEMARGASAFPYILILPQDRHEELLSAQCERQGIAIERNTELIDFEQDADRVVARLRRADGSTSTCSAAYLAGCDGARSRARQALGVGFPGGTYGYVFFVADIEARGPVVDDQLHIALDDSEFLAVFPLRGGGTARLVGPVRPIGDQAVAAPTWDDVGKRAIERLRLDIARVNWFSTYQVHHRVAGQFAKGRVFLLGDAAHIHSPVGGQGMNTGIGDAVNLAWKLADVLQGRAHAALLDSYEPERIAFARRLVATTDRWFVTVTSPGPIARFVRTRIVPRVAPVVTRFDAVRRFAFRTLSQTAIAYRHSRISGGRAGAVCGGDRLPWVALDGGSAPDNFAQLDGRGWQVHVYGAPDDALARTCTELGLPLHALPWQPPMQRAGLQRNAFYLLRPDGHVALAGGAGDAAQLAQHLARIRAGAAGDGTVAGAHAAPIPARAAAWCLVAAAVLFLVSWALMPGVGITDTREIFARVATQPGAVRTSAVLQLISAACYAPALLGLLHFVRGRAVFIGAALLLLGAMGSAADVVLHLLAVEMVAPGVDQAAMVPVMERMQGPNLRLLGPLVASFFVGTAVLAVTFARRGLVARRHPLLLALGIACAVLAATAASGAPGAARALALGMLACFAGSQLLLGRAIARRV